MWTCYTFTEDSHNTENFMPYSFRIVCGFFNIPQNCEHSRVVRRGLWFIVLIREDLKFLTICRCNYKGSTFSSVILRPWVLVQPESNSRPPAGQTVAQPTEPPVYACVFLLVTAKKDTWKRPMHWSTKCYVHADCKLPTTRLTTQRWITNIHNCSKL